MHKKILAVAAAASVATFSVAALHAQPGPPQPAAMDPSTATSGSYSADAAHSMVVWGVNHLGFNDYFGILGDVSGTLDLDVDDMTSSSVDVTIPLASVVVPSAGLRDHLLRPGQEGGAPDFFGPDPAPARFVSTSVHQLTDTTAEITGDLTFNGVTKPIVLQAKLAGMGTNMMSQAETLGFHATTTLKRSDWNMGFGIPFGIGDNVALDITVAFEKQ